MFVSVLIYGYEIWGKRMEYHEWRQVEIIQKYLITSCLEIKPMVPYKILFSEVQIFPMVVLLVIHFLRYLKKVENMDENMFLEMVVEEELRHGKMNWMK